MKFFNWTKIQCNSYDGTLWVKSDEDNIYKQLDLEDFETNFSAYQNLVANSQENDNLFSMGNTSLDLTASKRLSLDGTDMGLENLSKSKIKKVISILINFLKQFSLEFKFIN